jgi:hypothetical protein
VPTDFEITDRIEFVATMLQHAPSGSVLTIIGRLSASKADTLKPYRVRCRIPFRQSNRYWVTDESRLPLQEVLGPSKTNGDDGEVARRLLGLRLDLEGAPLVEAYHLYDYGSPSDAEHVAIVHESIPADMRKKWKARDAAEPSAT